MKRKTLKFANVILGALMTALGFSSCNNIFGTREVECIYGGPEMMNGRKEKPAIDEDAETDTVKQVIKAEESKDKQK